MPCKASEFMCGSSWQAVFLRPSGVSVAMHFRFTGGCPLVSELIPTNKIRESILPHERSATEIFALANYQNLFSLLDNVQIMATKRKLVPKLSVVTKLRILEEIKNNGYHPTQITRHLNSQGYQFHKSTLIRFYARYWERNSIGRAVGSGRKSKISPAILEIVQKQMARNPETTAQQLHYLLAKKHGIKISFRTILRGRNLLGWVFRGTKYCASIRPRNIGNYID